MGFWQKAFSLTPIGAAYNLLRIAHEHDGRGVRSTTIGWQIDETYTEDMSIPSNRPREYYRVIREAKVAREVKQEIKVKLPRLAETWSVDNVHS